MNIQEKIAKKLAQAPSERPITVAFLGDSVTHGCFEVIQKPNWGGAIDCIYDQESVYVTRFKKKFDMLFPQCPVSVINAGISGGSVHTGLERLERDVISYSPDVAVVAFGLNDVLSRDLDAYIGGLEAIFNELKKADITPVYLTENMLCTAGGCSPIEFLREISFNCAEIQNSGIFDNFIEKGRELCRKENIAICDCYADWKKLESYGVDITHLLSNYVNHPTREMHELFASRLIETIVL